MISIRLDFFFFNEKEKKNYFFLLMGLQFPTPVQRLASAAAMLAKLQECPALRQGGEWSTGTSRGAHGPQAGIAIEIWSHEPRGAGSGPCTGTKLQPRKELRRWL